MSGILGLNPDSGLLAGVSQPNPEWLSPGSQNYSAPWVGGVSAANGIRNLNRRVLAQMSVKADVQGAPAALADVADTTAINGATALRFTSVIGTNQTIAPLNALAAGVDVTGGLIRVNFRPVSQVLANIDRFTIELHSAGTPAAPTANYHQIDGFGPGLAIIKQMLSNENGLGDNQTLIVPVAQFVAAGTGATLTAITFARLVIRSKAGGAVMTMDIGNIEFLPNLLTKAKVVLGFDDSYASHLTYAAVQMARYGFVGMSFPSVATNIEQDASRLSVEQLKLLQRLYGWQIASQAWTTEDNTILEAMTEAQLTGFFAKLIQFRNTMGLYDGFDGSWFSNVAYAKTTKTVKDVARKMFRTMRAFNTGNGAMPPIHGGETFPFGDQMNVRALNGATAAYTGTELQAHVDQARTNKGVAIFIWHNELVNAGAVRTAFDALLVYLDANRATVDVCTIADIVNGNSR
jgi:hypothetical protein